MRASYGIGIGQIGDDVTYGEAWQLVQHALDDTSTPLCAELAEWSYPATLVQLLQLAATAGDGKTAERLMPWRMNARHSRNPSEIEQARREIDDEMLIASQ
jgi:hypothetical protein